MFEGEIWWFCILLPLNFKQCFAVVCHFFLTNGRTDFYFHCMLRTPDSDSLGKIDSGSLCEEEYETLHSQHFSAAEMACKFGCNRL